MQTLIALILVLFAVLAVILWVISLFRKDTDSEECSGNCASCSLSTREKYHSQPKIK